MKMQEILPEVENKESLLKEKCGENGYRKLKNLDSDVVEDFVARYVNFCNPKTVFVRGQSEKDLEYIRKKSIEKGEEEPLEMDGHTAHWDGYKDQARDKENTKFLLSEDEEIGPQFNSIEREKGLKEIKDYLKDIMAGKEVFLCFISLGPRDSPFSIPVIQLTDSTYVAHSEELLYRNGYDYFKNQDFESEEEIFKFVHSAGKLENGVSKNIGKRRVYTDLNSNIVFSTNTQYGGNTLGPKKLSMRLAIKQASEEGWLKEHMFIMGVKGPEGRKSYFTGAFPSACGKTSTSMLEGETLIGDDIAYLREIDGEIRGANPEKGIFGIIRDVNPEADPLIWKSITTPGDVIFSNVLVKDGMPYWIGMGKDLPDKGRNHSGKWHEGKTDPNGEKISPSHRNARYTLKITDLDNEDPKLNDPQGVKINGMIYGGRDSDTCVPVEEAFDWKHGILTKGATLESETTSATLGKSGERRFNPMSNLDFLSIPIGDYVKTQLDFGEKLEKAPSIFSVNYFLKDENGEYLNDMHDKRVWLKWMELRSNGDVEGIKTPTGYIPKYDDLKKIFSDLMNKNYSMENYEEQFKIRIPEHLAKIKRIKKIYKNRVEDPPEELFEELNKQKERLETFREKFGEYIPPSELE
ncbi:MAG: phosphoenolpyruvate carboxykinase (GTP) [Candidatus Hadarchaeia archaeon]